MKIDYKLKNKKRLPISQGKSILSILIITIIIIPSISVQAEISKDEDHPESYWKHYPYQPPGTDIVFPTDEGSHDTTQFPIEWWYVNFHLTGHTTGNEYGSYVAFYKIQSPVADKKEIRIFSISDIASEKTFNNVQIGTLTASTNHLDLSFKYITDNNKTNNQTLSKITTNNLISQNQIISTADTKNAAKCVEQAISSNTVDINTMQKTNPINTYLIDNQESSDGLIQNDHWYTKNNDQDLIPFQYILEVSGNSQPDDKPMNLIVNMDCIKKPLIVGGDGVIELGKEQRISFYYSLSKLAVVGSISVNGITEDISGFAWIDHQWGDFLNANQPPYGLVVSYEWFSIKLDDNREILAGNTWDQNTGERINKSFSDGLNLLNSDGTLELLNDYTIITDSFWKDEQSQKIFASKWHITEKSKSINLIITPLYANQMMRVGEDYPMIRQILDKIIPGAYFWEGVCTVTGSIDNIKVEGRAYVELTHHYDNEYGKG
jgi:predicted secreted hydrolase